MVSTQILSDKPEFRPKSDSRALKFKSLPWQPDRRAEYSRMGVRWFLVVESVNRGVSAAPATDAAVGI